ncbi:cell adhesion molecule-related/down-regulated by oncogenes-like [Mercenaria mercenaria]|uniref:cell adhesion molecule-related/down-regulated by oncogenes-like n=1 Tax=Mercenaria mercenaria TaxID=6596 RepID=UPI00234F04AE|nr:cell adhesion molecule-related/down-regulated by oncogenes-like [Mercenaria mercenaria]XP_053408069.1 cell adhesion molecule-related/down-regulated by oncogenes-like [Mercenaria mercenaria]XP_053408070.1 cell adhesion molecule-related/down-regulated by oncogenes-like [Mercenaria mercenaria]XP_053408071.1 cell adhesion molecule-related/down-regulated by oncogenes-like [Mercenaria mercenaria]XP_053408072.1 cell adhesion molecule-related/down-regulated by oncogenes-like [Mercenaria mercenaria]
MSSSLLTRTPLIELAILLAIFVTAWATSDMIPHFTVEPSSAVVSQNSPTTLSCRVEPSSSVVRWKFNGEYFEENNPYGFKQIGMDLHLTSLPDNGHESTFQCVAQSTLGTLLSAPVKISKAVLRKFEDRGDLHLNVSEGSNLVIPCQPPYSRPRVKVLYKYNHSTIIEKDTDHYKILPSGNLLIVKVTTADQGQYQCMAQNTLRNRTRTAKHSIHVHVLNTAVPRHDPAVIMPSTKLQALLGDDVVLECSAIGNPQPVISWEKYGGSLSEGRYRLQHGNLYLDKVTLEDEGTYLCKANNGINSLMLDGLKAMVLEVLERPIIQSVNPVINVSLGGLIELMCIVRGKPRPQITWYHDGNLLKAFNGESRLFIRNAEASHQGLYQCFAENSVGISHSSMIVNVDVTKRDSGSLTLSDQNVTKVPSSDELLDKNETSAGRESKRRKDSKRKSKRRKNRKKKQRHRNKARNLEPVKLVPPSKPEVNQLSDTSVMLNWTVPENDGLPITFFKVQYKKVAPKKGSWVTDDIKIDSQVRTFEVRGLKPRSTYKFRIAAVYTNDDNEIGENSDKFEMKVDPVPEAKPPSKAPNIVQVIPIDYKENHGLNVHWQHNVVTLTPIEGFYIYYKPFHAEKDPFQNVTLLEPSVRSHLLTNLFPGTEYLIRMQSFNGVGDSPYSNEVVERTKGSGGPYDNPQFPQIKPEEPTKNPSPVPPTSNDPEVKDDDTNRSTRTGTQASSENLYMILGIVLGVMMLLLIVFMFMCWWKQRQQRRQLDAMNDAVRNKFQDPSQRIYADSLRKKMLNGGLAINGINGTIANGHIPRNYHNMNINVNPLSELEPLNSTDGSNHYSPSSFRPNGTLPSHHRTSDNNCNNINQSKSLQNSLQHLNHHNTPSSGEGETLGSGESMANPPSPMCKNVPIGHNSDALDRRSLSNRSCDHGSCDPCDSSLSYDDTGGVYSSGRHRKRRRRGQCKEQTTKDQATNTDLSSNDGTMELSESNKAISSSQESGQLADNTQIVKTNSESEDLVPCSNAV